MAEVEQHATSSDPLLQCCLCTGLLREAVQLACLHNCCRQCFSTAASQSSSQGVACVSCGTVTEVGCEQPNGFVDGQVQCYTLNAESGMCGVCTEKGENDKSAVVWCLTCRHSLCEDCVTEHQVHDRQHTMQCLEELKSVDELCSQAASTACALHKRPLDLACLNCEQAKCSSCRVKCMEKNHVMHTVGEESFDSYVGNLVARISAMEKELQLKSEVLEKPRNVRRVTKESRDRHLNALKQRKRRIVDAVERAFEAMELSVTNAYGDLEAEGDDAAEAADGIASDLSDARNYIRHLLESNDKCEILKQHKIIRDRLSVLSDMLDSLNERLATTMGEVRIEASLPDDVEEVVGAWIGKLHVHSASSSLLRQQQQPQRRQCFSFGAASASVQVPVLCCDVSLTRHGRLLIAAWEHGLIEFSSSSGRELSRWRPPKLSSDRDDWVQAVAALSDGRAAVSLLSAKCVVLLRRREERRREKDGGRAAVSSWWQRQVAAGDDAWTEQLRVQLPWTPYRLSAHGDVLAASCEWHGNNRLQLRSLSLSGYLLSVRQREYIASTARAHDDVLAAAAGDHLQLLSLSSGQLLSTEHQRKYDIGSLAVTARAVVTGSDDKVKLDFLGRRSAYVLDAHSLADDDSHKRLWRHVLSSSDVKEEEEKLQGICADSTGRCLYAAVSRSDRSSRCALVCALSMDDGSELRRVALSFNPAAAAPAQPMLLPVLLSLSEDATLSSSSSGRVLLLAVLWDSETNKCRTVTVHRSTSDELP